MTNDAVHPDLQKLARFAPRRLVGPRTLPIMRAAMDWRARLGKPVRDVEVITLESGPASGCSGPPVSASRRPRCCGFTAADT
ncbi:lipW domain protein [Mycobacterium intracellulare 1956]|uniref:LipW domain protein n=1 Tax=Mycobacterium intracellulare 1956 TaxID=1299331 RepID=X8CE78_MYCIT|nr:lipW domain protein [Mycobacterium intracellulare 1956]